MNSIFLAINNYELIYVVFNVELLIIAALLTEAFCQAIANPEKNRGRLASLFIFGGAWLIFLPNTAYLIAEIRHLIDYCPSRENDVCMENAWMIAPFFIYAWIGYFSFIVMTRRVVRALIINGYRRSAYLAPFVFVPLTALGIVAGLINRWNTSDIMNHAPEIFSDVFQLLTAGEGFWTWIWFSALLGFLYSATSIIAREWRLTRI